MIAARLFCMLGLHDMSAAERHDTFTVARCMRPHCRYVWQFDLG